MLAFGFGSPLMLWGLAAGSIPILIHLLHRRRFQTVNWAAMRFLLAATKKQSRRMKLEQLLLLLVRTMIVLFIALALSRPMTETMGQYLQTDGPRHRIVVVDSTFSMGYAPTGRSRFDRAKEIARRIVAGCKQGDAINLVRICESIPRVIVRRPAYQSAAVVEEIEQLTLLDERVDASIVLKEINELLSLEPDLSRKEIYLVTDLQSATWAPPNTSEAQQVRQELKRLSERAKIVWVDAGESSSPNMAVTSLRSEDQFALTSRSVRTAATVKNFGATNVSGQLVELVVDGRLTDTKRVDIAAGQEVPVDFSPSFGAGEHRLEIRLQHDPLPIDDVRRLVIPVRDELQVLLINGKPSGQPMGNATDFLKLALAPEAASRANTGAIKPTVIREGELLGTDLSRFDCVFICNVALFTDREAEVLRGYLDAGGGVVFSLGDQVRPENYNEILHRGKSHILPAKLIERIGDAKKKETSYQFDAGDYTHPIVRPFQGNAGSGLELTKTFAYMKTDVDSDRGASVALRFNSGDPAIIDAPYGRGRVILITTSLDRDWSTWAVWGHSLIPLIHETVNAAIAGRWKDRSVLVGQPLQCHLGLRSGNASSTHVLPNGDSRPVQPSADGRMVVTEPTTTSGFHQVILGPPTNRTDWFAVNVDPIESDLASLRLDDLRTDVMPGIDFKYLTEWEDNSTGEGELIRMVETGTSLSRGLLVAAAALLLVEQLMAWNFVAGTVLLLTFVMGSLAWNVYRLNSFVGILLTILILFGVVAIILRVRPNGLAGIRTSR